MVNHPSCSQVKRLSLMMPPKGQRLRHNLSRLESLGLCHGEICSRETISLQAWKSKFKTAAFAELLRLFCLVMRHVSGQGF